MTRRSTTFVTAVGLFMVVGTVALATMVAAQSEDRFSESRAESARCSNRTLRGDYGFSIEGTILAGTPNAFSVRGVSMTHFDGDGNLTQVDFTTRNGAPLTQDWRPAVGTYEINPDCTGTAHIIQSDGTPSLNLRLVVVDRGRQVLTTVVGNSTSSIGIRVD